MLTDGWSGPEDWGVWAIGGVSPRFAPERGWLHEVGRRPALGRMGFPAAGRGEQKMSRSSVGDSARGEPIAQWTLGPHGETKVLCIPPSAIAAGQLLTLFFKTNGSYSPSGARGRGDARRLDFAARWLSLSQGPCLPPSRLTDPVQRLETCNLRAHANGSPGWRAKATWLIPISSKPAIA